MFKQIDHSMMEIWNKRFKDRMNDLGLSQRTFIKQYKERFGTGSQSDVSKWMNVGYVEKKSKGPRNFPEFKTMCQIAEILHVSVSYLTGESDFESYDLEKASKYLGLSSNSLKSIRDITMGKSIPPFHKIPDPKVTNALELLLSSPALVEHLKNLGELLYLCKNKPERNYYFNKAIEQIPSSLQEDAIDLWSYEGNNIEELGITLSDEMIDYVQSLDRAACKDMEQPDLHDKELKALRYAIHESNTKLIDEILDATSGTA